MFQKVGRRRKKADVFGVHGSRVERSKSFYLSKSSRHRINDLAALGGQPRRLSLHEHNCSPLLHCSSLFIFFSLLFFFVFILLSSLVLSVIPFRLAYGGAFGRAGRRRRRMQLRLQRLASNRLVAGGRRRPCLSGGCEFRIQWDLE